METLHRSIPCPSGWWTQVVYCASDGKEFYDRHACKLHEEYIKHEKELAPMGEEMYEGIESTIEDLIEDYKKIHPNDCYQEYHKRGAIEALEKLIQILNE